MNNVECLRISTTGTIFIPPIKYLIEPKKHFALPLVCFVFCVSSLTGVGFFFVSLDTRPISMKKYATTNRFKKGQVNFSVAEY